MIEEQIWNPLQVQLLLQKPCHAKSGPRQLRSPGPLLAAISTIFGRQKWS